VRSEAVERRTETRPKNFIVAVAGALLALLFFRSGGDSLGTVRKMQRYIKENMPTSPCTYTSMPELPYPPEVGSRGWELRAVIAVGISRFP